jgi:hypothetical protein
VVEGAEDKAAEVVEEEVNVSEPEKDEAVDGEAVEEAKAVEKNDDVKLKGTAKDDGMKFVEKEETMEDETEIAEDEVVDEEVADNEIDEDDEDEDEHELVAEKAASIADAPLLEAARPPVEAPRRAPVPAVATAVALAKLESSLPAAAVAAPPVGDESARTMFSMSTPEAREERHRLMLRSLARGPYPMPTTVGYSKQKAYSLGVLSYIVNNRDLSPAYMDPLLRQLFGDAVYVRRFAIVRENAAAMVVECRDFLVLVWAPTNEDKDWGQNFKAVLETFAPLERLSSKFKAHAGFQEHVNLLWPQIAATLDALLAAKRRPVMMAGHSLGGAAALLSALRFVAHRNLHKDLNCLYTFGQPRVLNGALAKYVTEYFSKTKKYYRYTHNSDIVPRMPPGMFVFKHAGNNIHITYHQSYKKVLRNPSALQLSMDRLIGAFLDIGDGDFDAVADHGANYYWAISEPDEHKQQPETELDNPRSLL